MDGSPVGGEQITTFDAPVASSAAAPREVGARKLAFGVVPAFRKFELRQVRYQDLVQPIARIAEARGPLDILDVGSGFGFAKRFADHADITARWTGVEICPERAKNCRSLGYQQVIADLDLERRRLPAPDGSFDVVIASHILEHLEDAAGVLEDWYRVLRPGGVLLIGVPMHVAPAAAAARWRYKRLGRRPYGHCHFFTLRSLQRLVEPYPVHDIRGFRLFSARKWLPLEDYRWFYRWSLRFGARHPGLTAEVNVEIRKPTSR